MSERERRTDNRTEDAELDLHHQTSRQVARKIESRRALQRLVGSYLLGGGAAWKLFTYEELPHVDGETHGVPWFLVTWIVLALVSFGLASFDQVVKVFKR